MNYSLQNRNAYLVSRRSIAEILPKDCYLPSDNRPAIPFRINKPGQTEGKKDQSNKWYKDPKIPVQMNSSTLIRMKNNANAGLDNAVRKESNNQLTLNALTFLKRDRRMSDIVQEKYEIMPKGVLPFDKNSYIKDVFSRVVSSGDNATLQEHKIHASANPSGDSASHSATYHRVSALSINDLRSGCNVKYFEEVSFRAKTSLEPEMKISKRDGLEENTSDMHNLRITPSCELKSNCNTVSKIIPEENNHDANYKEDDSSYNVLIKKKIKKNKKPVVVTCLKNSSVKFVRRK